MSWATQLRNMHAQCGERIRGKVQTVHGIPMNPYHNLHGKSWKTPKNYPKTQVERTKANLNRSEG